MIDCKVCCKICEQTLCRHAGTQRGLEVDCRYYMPRQEHQTNADRIRAMSDEELAWELMTWRIETCARLNGAESPYPHTQKSILDWLRQPVKDGGNDGRKCKHD